MKNFLYIFIQCTWGAAQTLIGLIFFIAGRKCPHERYKGSIDTKWNAKGGLSPGLFIFTPKDGQANAQLIRVHEYGHTIQPPVLGPLMFFIGVIPVTWGNLPYFDRRRREDGVPCTACFAEAWAGKRGELAAKEKAIRQ